MAICSYPEFKEKLTAVFTMSDLAVPSEEKIQKLVDMANAGGGGDNITVVLTSLD